MRIVTWNMGCAERYRATHDDAWRYLLDALRPDVALVQEALVAAPAWVAARGALALRPSRPGLDWGSGVFVAAGEARPVDLPDVPGLYAVATEVVREGAPVVVASVHVCPDDHQQDALRALVDRLVPALRGERVVLGGDLNAARRWDEVHGRGDYGWLFDALARAGLADCHWRRHGREQPSFWGRQGGTRYQLDHVFVRDGWASAVTACDVHDAPEVRALSDHGPVVLDLDA